MADGQNPKSPILQAKLKEFGNSGILLLWISRIEVRDLRSDCRGFENKGASNKRSRYSTPSKRKVKGTRCREPEVGIGFWGFRRGALGVGCFRDSPKPAALLGSDRRRRLYATSGLSFYRLHTTPDTPISKLPSLLSVRRSLMTAAAPAAVPPGRKFHKKGAKVIMSRNPKPVPWQSQT